MPQPPPDELKDLFGGVRPEPTFGLERKVGMQMVLASMERQDSVPPKIGRYVVREKIGEGGMGAVYRVDDPELERSVALKVMRVLTSASQRETLKREARALAALAHPNVVTVHDIGMADGQLYVTMEFVPGRTLRAWLAEPTTRSWREIVRIFLEAANGLAAAHDVGIVHRDFKPENVLLGHDGRIRVLDFGLARRSFAGLDASGTETASVAGTPGYMAPEALDGGTVTALSDQYSFCRALGEILATRVEGAGKADEPPELWEVVERGTRLAPDARYPGMEAVVAALEKILVTPVTDEHREPLLERIEEAWLREAESVALIPTAAIPLPLALATDAVPNPRAAEAFDTADQVLDTRHLATLLARADGALLILGQPGAGKSTSLRQLAGQLLDQARRDAARPVPVLLNLASFGDEEMPIEDWIEAEVFIRYGIPARHTRRRLDAEAWVLLFDGLDEVADIRRQRCVREINRLLDSYPCPVTVACRERTYEELTERLNLRAAVRLTPLPLRERDAFVANLGAMGEPLARVLARDPARREQLETPLLLALAALGGDDWSPAPSETRLRTELYRHFVDDSFGPGAGDQDGRMRRALRWTARTMRARSLTELWLERLQPDWLPDRPSRLLAMGLGVLFVTLIIMGSTLLSSAFSDRTVRDAALIGAGTVPIALLFNRGLKIRPVDALRWSWRRSLYWLPRASAAGFVAGGLFGLFYVFWINAVSGVMAGMIVSLPLGLESSDEVTQLRPNRSIRRSALNAITVGPMTGLVTGIAWGYVLTPLALPYLGPESMIRQLDDPVWAAVCTGFFGVGSLAGMAAGGTAVVLHGALRLVLALRTPLPLGLVSFLDRAASRGLLRRIGGGYVFPHRTLREYLALEGSLDPRTATSTPPT